jgi:DNA-binding transcriptional regulator GbsR (MarR family)
MPPVHFCLNKLNLLLQIQLMPLPLVEKEPPQTGPDRLPAAQLTPLETEVIDFFVQLSRLLGQPRSLAEIYGLLFISGRPLAMDDLIERLQLSKGTASQGLKFLCNIGAARMVYVAGERRTHYEAVAELRNLATRFLRDQIVPHLDNGQARLERIADMLRELPLAERARINGRVRMLQSWGRQGRRFLPLVVKILGK